MQKKNRAFNAETSGRFNPFNILGRLILLAHADDGAEPTSSPEGSGEPTPQLNFEAMVAQARKEEKDKLYPRLNKAENEVKELTKSLNQYLIENATLKKTIEDLKSQSSEAESETVANLKKQVADLQAEIDTLRKATPPDEDAIREKVRAEYEVKLYAQQQLDANKGEILSMFHSDIVGESKEDIDKAIASAKEKTLSVKKDLGLVDSEGKPKSTSGSKKTVTSGKPEKPPVAAPATGSEGETFDAEYIRNLDPRSPEYAEFRKKMGLK